MSTLPSAEQVAATVGPPPAAVQAIAAGRPLLPVWRNAIGGVTFRIDDGAAGEYVAYRPHHPEVDVGGEAARLAFAGRYVVVPRVLGTGHDEHAEWLHTAGLAGSSAASERWRATPLHTARIVGAGLRLLHDALPVDTCPFEWSVTDRVARHAKEQREPAAAFAARLGPVPPVDRTVVCHGDPCTPNTLVADDGSLAGHVDLGALGVADRWADLAVATWSVTWNLGPGYEGAVLDAYGVGPDPWRTAFYRALWGGPPLSVPASPRVP